MSVMAIGYFLICSFLNVGIASLGHINIKTGDKDIFFPFSAMLLLFYPLLIYLPEAHYKIVIFGRQNISPHDADEEQQVQFPIAFFITLLSFTIAAFVHHFIENKDQVEEKSQNKNIQYKKQTQILKYFLSVAIGLQNIVQAFYITQQTSQQIVFNQFIIYCIFSLLINFAYGYICGWTGVPSDLHKKLAIFINVGILIGFLLGLVFQNNPILVALPCLSCGLMIYSCMMICFPCLFSGGQNPTQDKFRYCSTFTALLLSVVYHPFCYLLRL